MEAVRPKLQGKNCRLSSSIEARKSNLQYVVVWCRIKEGSEEGLTWYEEKDLVQGLGLCISFKKILIREEFLGFSLGQIFL